MGLLTLYLGDPRTSHAIWLAVRNLLLPTGSPELARSLLDEVEVRRRVRAVDGVPRKRRWRGTPFRCARSFCRPTPSAGPPLRVYLASLRAKPGSDLLASGVRRVCLERRDVQPGNCARVRSEPDSKLERRLLALDYLRQMSGLGLEEFEDSSREVTWTSDEALLRVIQAERDRFDCARDEPRTALQSRGWIERGRAIPSRLALRVSDRRDDRSEALPTYE